jgi:hypothetical protein
MSEESRPAGRMNADLPPLRHCQCLMAASDSSKGSKPVFTCLQLGDFPDQVSVSAITVPASMSFPPHWHRILTISASVPVPQAFARLQHHSGLTLSIRPHHVAFGTAPAGLWNAVVCHHCQAGSSQPAHPRLFPLTHAPPIAVPDLFGLIGVAARHTAHVGPI